MKNYTLIASLLFINLSLSSKLLGNDIQPISLEQIIKLENSGKLIEALKQAEKLYEKAPSKIVYFNSYLRLLVKNNRTQDLKVLLKQESSLNAKSKEDWQSWFWLGSAQLILGNIDKAGFYLDEAVSKRGDNASIWVQKAIIEQEKDNHETAIHFLQIANSLSPQNPDILINYAYSQEKTKNLDKSIQAYKQFLRLSTSKQKYGKLRVQVMLRVSQMEAAKKTSITKVEEY